MALVINTKGLKVANKTLAIFKSVYPPLMPEYIVSQINKELKTLSDLTGISTLPVTNIYFIASYKSKEQVTYHNIVTPSQIITKPKMIKEAVKAYFKNWTKLNKSDPEEWPS
ncbi:2461_t:CDS:2 [Dentiscutata erythropus]|uniref:2461_t:CDS:1 n=1 Tax=Dentiscutata erythropus TaxID=1348616 RepID=A0A9N9DJJ7_9GLOM|nr:2461_t:CDS:2 [Dentiscutata erythropus]